MRSDLAEDISYPSKVTRIKTPNGVMFLTVVEDNHGNPIRIIIQIGKTGTGIRAWADATGRLINLLLERGAGIEEVITQLSNIHSSDLVFADNSLLPVKSGPDALVKALLIYKRSVYRDLKNKLNIKRRASFNNYDDP
jgi:hypothetical protein